MLSKFDKVTILLFSLLSIYFLLTMIINIFDIRLYIYGKPLHFLEIPGGDWVVGLGTSLLGYYTWWLARTEINEGIINRELQAIDTDLKEVYTEIRNILRSGLKEGEYLIISKADKDEIDKIFHTVEYRITDEIVSFWEENIKGIKATPHQKDPGTGLPIIYRIYHPFEQLIEQEYTRKKERYKELTSSV